MGIRVKGVFMRRLNHTVDNSKLPSAVGNRRSPLLSGSNLTLHQHFIKLHSFIACF